MIEETGWLIELKGTQSPMWWGRVDNDEDGVCGWTSDPAKAIRFCRAVDALAIIDENGWTEAIPTDHMWCDYSHKWVPLKIGSRQDLESCSECGVVRRADDKNGPCKGPMKLRPMEKSL
jgi:hypothetical protein